MPSETLTPDPDQLPKYLKEAFEKDDQSDSSTRQEMYRDLSDRELLEKVREGDLDAIEEMTRRRTE